MAHPAGKTLGHCVVCRQGQAFYIIWSAQHFETDQNFYNTDMGDYTLVNDNPVGFIAVVYKSIRVNKTYIYNAITSAN